MELMGDIEEESPDMDLGVVMVIAEARDDDGVRLHIRCSDDRTWVQLGLLEAGAHSQREHLRLSEDDD